jgi:tight adherence protein B
MTIQILLILIFLVTMALVVLSIYYFIEIPSARRRVHERMTSAKSTIMSAGSEDEQVNLLRSEVMSNVPFLHRILVSLPGSKQFRLFVQQSAVNITPGMLVTLSVLILWIVFLLTFMVGAPFSLALLLALLGAAIPFIVIGILRQRRFLRFEEIFPDAIDLLARAVRAGHAFTTGLDLISKELPAPVSEEFARAYDEQNLGLPVRDVFINLTTRVPLIDVRIFVTALLIQRESGGNLAEILDNLSYVIRERFKLMRQIKVYTAQGRLSLYFLVAIAPLMGVMVYFINPKYIMRLFEDPIGHILLITGIILQVMGYFVIRKIIQPRF